ncbi:MAG: tRNA adenosine(34) deaminase TadA [Coxiellaceae bacterium]|nr:tRNA adenosine(34) deaminase TadA [Coxiellaceae bacterium]
MTDQDWIAHALKLAKRAADEDEVPVGAVLVRDNEILGEGWNQPISRHDPTAHAEIQAIRQASFHLSNYRLLDTTLYVTLEPCVMCVGAIVHARIGRLVYGADDPKAGAVKSQMNLLESSHFNHQLTCSSGLMADECGQLLTQFFEKKREDQKRRKQGIKKPV